MPEAIRMQQVSRYFGEGDRRFPALKAINLAVEVGELVLVLGRSGSGKTTLLSLIGGLDRPDEGSVHVIGEELTRLQGPDLDRFRAQAVGWVFQTSGLLPLLTAEENVALGLRIQLRPAAECLAPARLALESVGLAERAGHRAHELSGGEQQRVALARALVKKPAVLLADEPTGQLDSETAREVMLRIRGAAAAGITVMVATHDAGWTDVADRVLNLEDGRIAG